MNYIKSKYILPLVFILILFFALRWQNIQSIPVFGDEAIYLRWSQLIKNVDSLRFVPQSDGKQPLFMWLTAVNYKLVSDPLVAGRLISVIAGALILTSLFIFSLINLNLGIAIISSIVYLLLPFSFFFDRLALPDNLLSSFGATSLLLAFLLAKYPRLDISLILGFSLGAAWLTKSPAIYFVVLSFITFILYNSKNYKKLYLPVISSILAYIIYNILRLGPGFQQIALRNRDYIWSLSEILRHPLDPLIPHLKDVVNIYSNYISIPIILLVVASFFLSAKTIFKNKNIFLISLWWLLPIISNATMAKVFTARYILFTLPPLILLISVGIYHFFKTSLVYFKSRYLQVALMILCILPNIFWIYKLSTKPFSLTLSSTETGYVSGWTSGWGIKSASDYLITRSKTANVIVGTEGYFGTMPDGLQIYTDSLPQLTVFGVGIDINKIPDKLIDARAHGDEVYLLFNQSRLKLTPTDIGNLTLIATYPKPLNDQLVLYRLN